MFYLTRHLLPSAWSILGGRHEAVRHHKTQLGLLREIPSGRYSSWLSCSILYSFDFAKDTWTKIWEKLRQMRPSDDLFWFPVSSQCCQIEYCQRYRVFTGFFLRKLLEPAISADQSLTPGRQPQAPALSEIGSAQALAPSCDYFCLSISMIRSFCSSRRILCSHSRARWEECSHRSRALLLLFEVALQDLQQALLSPAQMAHSLQCHRCRWSTSHR